MVEIGDRAKAFGAHLDDIAGCLVSAATDLESDAGRMAAAAERTSRRTSDVWTASDRAPSNVATVASAAEQLAFSIAEINRQVATERVHGEVETLRREVTRFLQRLTSAA